MATVNEKMTAIADAIRSKTGETELLTLDEMVADIDNIAVGTQDAIVQGILDRTITEIDDNGLVELGQRAFYGCNQLISARFSKCKSVGNGSFSNNTVLEEIDFEVVEKINRTCFSNSLALTKIIIRTPKVCTIATDSFSDTNVVSDDKTCFIYVPDNLIEEYKAATNWVAIESQIKPISELEG